MVTVMNPPDLHRLLLEDARRYDAGVQARGLLVPFRDVILLQRAKYMSYEQISATFCRHGLRVSPAAVGAFWPRVSAQAISRVFSAIWNRMIINS